MRCYLLPGFALLASTILAGCVTENAPSMSLDEARALTVTFQAEKVILPDRSINDFRHEFQDSTLIAFPGFCKERRAAKAWDLDLLTKYMGQGSKETQSKKAADLLVAAEQEFINGRFELAISLTEKAYDRLGPEGSKVRQAVMMTQIGRMRTIIGDFSGAQEAFRTARVRWRDAGGGWVSKPRGRMMVNAANASEARIAGDLMAEEHFLRETLKFYDQAGYNSHYYHLSNDQITARLATNLTQQGRYVEAELAARRLVSPELKPYDFVDSRLLSYGAMSEALYAQGRLEDALFFAQLTVRYHHSACSLPDAIPLVEAWRTLLKTAAALGRWEVVEQAETALKAELTNKRYQELFAANPDILLTRAFTGRLGGLVSRINRLVQRLETAEGTDPARLRELILVKAVALQHSDQPLAALKAYQQAIVPYLSAAYTGSGATRSGSGEGRAEFFRHAYLSFLNSPTGIQAAKTEQVDRIAELFQVATMMPSGAVQRSFTASSVRAAARDPELAALVRQTQDVEEQIRDAEDLLVFLETSQDKDAVREQRELVRANTIALNAARATLIAETTERFPAYAELMAPKTLDLASFRASLKPHEAALIVRTIEDQTYIWAIPAKGEVAFHSVAIGENVLKEQVDRLRSALDPGAISALADIPDFDLALGYDVYSEILKPVEAGWKSAKSLLVIAHGPLGYLPFSLLPTQDSALAENTDLLFANYRDVAWLARTHAVTVLPSVDSVKMLRDGSTGTVRAPRAFAGFGDPYFSTFQARDAERTASRGTPQIASRGFRLRSAPDTRKVDSATLSLLPRLPDTAPEISAIADVMGADPTRDVFLGARASETVAKSGFLEQYRVISFATHGLVPGDLNGLSEPALALSSPRVTKQKDEDGLLTMGEILGLTLNADWVVLSACNTAAGEGQGAEAISGLGRAFFYAGSKSLLVSNWPVFSSSTTALMTDLFRRIAQDDTLSRAEALRQARLDLMDQAVFTTDDGKVGFSYAHPIFWAPFVIAGEGA